MRKEQLLYKRDPCINIVGKLKVSFPVLYERIALGTAKICTHQGWPRRDPEVGTELENTSKGKVFAMEGLHLLATLSGIAGVGNSCAVLKSLQDKF